MTVPKKKSRCLLKADGRTVVFKTGVWSEIFDISDLKAKIAFYEKLRDRRDGAYSKHYTAPVEALKGLERRISASDSV